MQLCRKLLFFLNFLCCYNLGADFVIYYILFIFIYIFFVGMYLYINIYILYIYAIKDYCIEQYDQIS